MKRLIRGGWVLNGELQTANCELESSPDSHAKLRKSDILIEDEHIIRIGSCGDTAADCIMDASGLLIAPGLIDMHVHLREPGREDKETVQSGTYAAAQGGFTTVACMPNTQPTVDSPEALEYILNQAEKYGSARVCPIASITCGLQGNQATDWNALLDAGACGFSDDGRTVMNAEIMRRLLLLSADRGFPVISHCEDPHLAGHGVMNAGKTAEKLGLPGIPNLAEDTIVERDIALAEDTGGHIHIAHVSTRVAVRHVRQAKQRGVHVTAEATPHHFTLTDTAILEHGANAKMNPPLRSQQDVDAVIEGLVDGTIDVIATDHAPHAAFEKAQGMLKAPFGIIGLETCVPLVISKLVQPGYLSLEKVISMLTVQPASILGLEAGQLAPGAVADITLIDLERQEFVDPTRFMSKSRNTPFAGWELQGWPVMTIRRGEVVARR